MSLSTTAETAFGTLLKICSDASATSPTTIAEVRDFTWGVNARVEESTSHSTATPWVTKVPTLLSFGPVEFMVNWTPTAATQNDTTGLLYVMKQRAERTYQIVETDSGTTTVQFNAVIASIKQSRPVGGLRTGSITLDGTGLPDFSV
jgi:hypothetical protein